MSARVNVRCCGFSGVRCKTVESLRREGAIAHFSWLIKDICSVTFPVLVLDAVMCRAM